ncbi:hypothetical protein [Pseudomonas sp. DP16D-R1]|uniref:hypothetical protein n=1 Tax=Pseudomonas sp. DP16D-R1 TaxID=2075551 RepID=UPI000CD1E417|nr:hypothetical protein [Pseudomonas sp. DP16D-R1]POA79808.1 hypothetical protein C1890_05500 [Pseudomonas sp. DP16D-R1]
MKLLTVINFCSVTLAQSGVRAYRLRTWNENVRQLGAIHAVNFKHGNVAEPVLAQIEGRGVIAPWRPFK